MALSLVTNLLTTLQPLVEKEVGLLLGVDEEMTKLSSTLSTIEAVLEDAERNHPEDRAIQDWLRKLKDAAYEVDDILDECSTEILRWESKGQSSGSLKKVGTSLLYPFKNVKFRHRIGHMMKEISVKLAAIADERNKFHFRNMVVENRDEFTKSRETSSLLTLPELIGRNQDKEKIIKVLLEDALERDEEFSVYPIIDSEEDRCKIWFKMHDLVHDLAQYIVKDERHMMEYRGSSDAGDRKVREVSTRMLREGDEATHSPFQPDKCDFRKFGSLRVFEARGIDIMKLPSSIDKLKHLRYLDVSGSGFNHLPNSICTLWNLQTLILDRCYNLKRLPSNMKCLRNLRHLHLSRCSLTEMPPKIGQLTCLKELSLFVVGKNKGCHLAELQHLNLGGELRIEHLERVKNPMDAKEANLVGKHNLRVLILCWEDNDESESQENIEELIEALEPHPNIEKLVIENYYGTHLPHWMMDIKNIDLIELRNCKNCLKLPPIGQLPLLRSLSILSMDKVNYIDDDLPDGGPVRGFPSLEVLTMQFMSSLKGLSRKEGKELFPLLGTMKISSCPNLSFRSLSALKSLSVGRFCTCAVLESISTCESLTSLKVGGNQEAICFPEEVLRNLTLLKSLDIYGFTKLESFPNGLAHLKELKSLTINFCDKLKSLQEEGLRGLESLQRLSIRYCKEFSSLSEGLQHLVCLESLEIEACRKLVALPEGVKHLKSLQSVRMSGYSNGLVALPETLQHVPALQYLHISYPTLTSLPDWLGNLTTLQSLIILGCPKISSLPASIQRLTKLRNLYIIDCGRELARRCEKGKGEDWHKIAHISRVGVDARQSQRLVEKWLRPQFGCIVGGSLWAAQGDLRLTNWSEFRAVKNPMDAKEPNLVGKHNLRMLILRWEDNDESESQENVEELLEALEPHPNIEKLVIENYYGTHLSRWMMDLKNIDLIELRNCKNCLKLPPIGQLPLLRRLSIWSMDKVNYIDDDLPDGGPVTGFPSLEVLTLDNLLSSKGLSRKEGKELFPLLRRMEITSCPNLSFRSLSTLKILSVLGPCTNAAICLPEEVLGNLTLLKSLEIYEFTKLKSFPNGLAHLKALKSLSIVRCHNFKSLPKEGLRGLESLQCLSIINCKEFSSLSEGLQHLVCLESLRIIDCPKLVALPEGVKHLKSLQCLQMRGGFSNGLVALPETLQHVPALQYLLISSYPTLTSLPDWLGNLTTLQSLIIFGCPKISSLPASIERLTELRSLSITHYGPELTRRCEKGKGEDWHKTTHIPQVEVYDQTTHLQS
ncbi:hypothetical protein RHSIM_Rhsim05G0016700 [Rhododendron simsii]|uniref:Rx N-terminal domain-containing protein n=1 Tax=Rhododendron simsii TaxID=118357 RepID=A0A834GUR1_RHOSS|nr:hypothetical protein RHSIM_Rhsim05G0016700 [Rhododendron simsii]